MITFDDALALIDSRVAPLGCERVSMEEAAGRTLATDAVAALPSPRHTISAMDGYAVRLDEVEPGVPLRVTGEVRPGQSASALASCAAVRIFTGGVLPEGANCVIMQEYATRDGDSVRFAPGFGPARHVRQKGSDFDRGDVVLSRGTKLDARSLVAAAATDAKHLAVYRQPSVSVLATGDELVASGSAHESAYAIPDAIGPALGAMIQHAGGKVVSRGFARDDLPALERLAGQLAQDVDLVVVTGGASVGERDFAKPMFAAHGLELQFDRVAMKPGKPVWFGRVKDCWVIGLPGNPTSAMVTARLLLDPILGRLQGATRGHLWRSMPLASALPATGDRETFARARWDATGLTVLGNQDSGVQGGLAKADWLIRCPSGQSERAAGTMVSALQF